jgi:hypothetical protein
MHVDLGTTKPRQDNKIFLCATPSKKKVVFRVKKRVSMYFSCWQRGEFSAVKILNWKSGCFDLGAVINHLSSFSFLPDLTN